MSNIRKLGKEDAASTKLTIAGKKVTATYTCRKDKDSPDRYAVESTLDFSNCSQDEILEMASRTVVIDLQRQWRTLAKSNLANATKPGTFGTIDVKRDVVEATRKAADPTTKVVSVLDKMSDAEREALLARYAQTARKKAS
jgi:hypothetical protein